MTMTRLRGRTPSTIPKRLKLLLYGPAGAGKTYASIQMPKPYILYADRGCDHYGPLIEKSSGAVFQTTVMAEIIQEVRSLVGEEHPYLTLVIDPVTTVYQDLLDEAEREVGTSFGRHYGEANKQMKRLTNLVMSADMNVIVTAHAKAVYADNMKQVGQTFDGWKRLDYLFDLVLELERRGQKRIAKVVKTRLGAFPDGDEFEWSYDAVADRYGRATLEKEASPLLLATAEHQSKFKQLTKQLSAQERQRLGIDRAVRGFADLADMPDERIVRGIELIENHLTQGVR